MSDMDQIRDALPKGWQILRGHESHGRVHTGVLILTRTPVAASEDLKAAAYSADSALELAISKDMFLADPDFKENRDKLAARLMDCFDGTKIYAKEIPNEYWGNSAFALGSPWFIVTTPIGHIKIGWRKKVIVIDYSDSAVTASAYQLFPNESVTKGDRMIHAWGYDKAIEYIRRLTGADAAIKELAEAK